MSWDSPHDSGLMLRSMVAVAFLVLMFSPIDHRLGAQRVERAGVSTRARSDTSATPAASESRASLWGAGIGALVGGADGLLMGIGGCDGAGPQRTCITQIAVGGVVVGAVLGYGIGWLIGHGRE